MYIERISNLHFLGWLYKDIEFKCFNNVTNH
jgi:hypothetical protein